MMKLKASDNITWRVVQNRSLSYKRVNVDWLWKVHEMDSWFRVPELFLWSLASYTLAAKSVLILGPCLVWSGLVWSGLVYHYMWAWWANFALMIYWDVVDENSRFDNFDFSCRPTHERTHFPTDEDIPWCLLGPKNQFMYAKAHFLLLLP